MVRMTCTKFLLKAVDGGLIYGCLVGLSMAFNTIRYILQKRCVITVKNLFKLENVSHGKKVSH